MSNRPVARITAKAKYENSYNVTFGDREVDAEEVADMIASGDFWLNFFWNDEESDR